MTKSRRQSVERFIFPQRVLDLRPIRTFEEKYLEAVSSRRSASPHSRRPSVERFIFPQRVLGYKTHLLEIYTSPTTLTPHFFYLCYSLKSTARDEWLGYISESWQGFLLSIDPKPSAFWSCSFSGHRNELLGEPRGRWEKAAKGCLELYFFGSSQRATGVVFCRELTKSRRPSGRNVFSGYISEGWQGFL